jgi:hypothetical protein
MGSGTSEFAAGCSANSACAASHQSDHCIEAKRIGLRLRLGRVRLGHWDLPRFLIAPTKHSAIYRNMILQAKIILERSVVAIDVRQRKWPRQ